MQILHTDTSWLNLFGKIHSEGSNVYPRGRATREILNGTAVINMSQPIVTNPNRRLGYRFMAREAWWILSGRNDVKSIEDWGNIAQFSDDGIFFFGAYGPRIISQLPYIIRVLTMDSESRQAVLSIWRDAPYATKDVPCSVTCQFLIRGGFLNVFLNMRSSDIWLGVPYDWFNFSMLGAYMVLILRDRGMRNLQLGNLYYTAASCHYYLKDEPSFLELGNDVREYTPLDIDAFENQVSLRLHLDNLSHGDVPAVKGKFAHEILDWKETRRYGDASPIKK